MLVNWVVTDQIRRWAVTMTMSITDVSPAAVMMSHMLWACNDPSELTVISAIVFSGYEDNICKYYFGHGTLHNMSNIAQPNLK